MGWRINHNFVGHPCERGVSLQRRRRWSRPARKVEACPGTSDNGIATSIRDNVTSVLFSRGIDYRPVGDDGSWLWCLGGPDLYRRPMPAGDDEYADANLCLDLNVWVCEEHEVISADLFPYDLVPESGGSRMDDPRKSNPVVLSNDAARAAADFLDRLEAWLDEILHLPDSDTGNDGR